MQHNTRHSKVLKILCLLAGITVARYVFYSYSNGLRSYRHTKQDFLFEGIRNITNDSYGAKLTNDSCKPLVIRKSKEPLPVTGLVSFPGAGNTWARHLLQQVSGIGTASVYCDSSLREGGFPFECDRERNRVLVVKSHRENSLKTFRRVILLIRNPYESILTFFHYRNSGHTGYTNNAKFFTGAWARHVNNQIRRWTNLHVKYLRSFEGPLYPLFYERLKNDTYNELQRVFEFLHYRVNATALTCTVLNQEGHFHRKKRPIMDENGHVLMKKDLYSKQMIENITKAVSEVQKHLETRYGIHWTVSLPDN